VYQYISERVAIPAVGLSFLGLLVGLSTSSLNVALSVSYILAILGMGYRSDQILRRMAKKETRTRKVKLWLPKIIIATSVLLPLAIFIEEGADYFTSFRSMQLGGAVALPVMLIVYISGLRERYKETHKPCPECCNVVIANARVCQYCSFRWQPRLEQAG
jgi:amino acid transporter